MFTADTSHDRKFCLGYTVLQTFVYKILYPLCIIQFDTPFMKNVTFFI